MRAACGPQHLLWSKVDKMKFSRSLASSRRSRAGAQWLSLALVALLSVPSVAFAAPAAARPASEAMTDVAGSQSGAAMNTANPVALVAQGCSEATFITAPTYNAGNGPRSVTTGDFNGDGKLDLATANFDSNNVSLLLGNGTGGFAAAVNFTVGTGPRSVTTGDFNGDGKLDLAVANS
ncbi:MAG: VCBS repeat-containing protein, partial [Acidobacteria bacterium]|nr:VCBS repeat-containing protein [Acidobacteriota bacterium]